MYFIIFRDFQADSEQLSARWDFSSEPCPIVKYYWAIYRIDDLELQPWTDTQGMILSQLAVVFNKNRSILWCFICILGQDFAASHTFISAY
jgi:hypothetical protein